MNKVQLYDAMVKLEWIICECEKVSTFGYGRWMYTFNAQTFFIGLWTFKVLFKVVVSGMLFKIYVCLLLYILPKLLVLSLGF